MDRGAWRITVHGIAKSWTRLSNKAEAQSLTTEILSPTLIFNSPSKLILYRINYTKKSDLKVYKYKRNALFFISAMTINGSWTCRRVKTSDLAHFNWLLLALLANSRMVSACLNLMILRSHLQIIHIKVLIHKTCLHKNCLLVREQSYFSSLVCFHIVCFRVDLKKILGG